MKGHFLLQLPEIQRPLCHELSTKLWCALWRTGKYGALEGSKRSWESRLEMLGGVFPFCSFVKTPHFLSYLQKEGKNLSLPPFLTNKLTKNKSRSKSLWIFFIIFQDRRNRSRNIYWMLAFLKALEGMRKIEDTGALASGTFQYSWKHKTDTLFDSGNHLFIHLNVHGTYLLSTYFASGTRCRRWQHGVDKDLHFVLKESLHGLLGHKEQQAKLLGWAGGDWWSRFSERGPLTWPGQGGRDPVQICWEPQLN